MKQSNGHVPDTMTAMESTTEQQQEVFQEDQQQIGNSISAEDAAMAAASGEIQQECSLAIKPKGPPLFKLRSVFLALFLSEDSCMGVGKQ